MTAEWLRLGLAAFNLVAGVVCIWISFRLRRLGRELALLVQWYEARVSPPGSKPPAHNGTSVHSPGRQEPGD